MGASARELIEEDSMVHGVRYRNRDGLHEVRCSFTVGADGRFRASGASRSSILIDGPFVGNGPRGLSVRNG